MGWSSKDWVRSLHISTRPLLHWNLAFPSNRSLRHQLWRMCALSNPKTRRKPLHPHTKNGQIIVHCVWNGEIMFSWGFRDMVCAFRNSKQSLWGSRILRDAQFDAHLHQSRWYWIVGVTSRCFEFLKLRRMIPHYLKPLPVFAIHSIKKELMLHQICPHYRTVKYDK